MSAGKGDKPRNCHSSKFKTNYDEIKWDKKKEPKVKVKQVKNKKVYIYG